MNLPQTFWSYDTLKPLSENMKKMYPYMINAAHLRFIKQTLIIHLYPNGCIHLYAGVSFVACSCISDCFAVLIGVSPVSPPIHHI